ncbi:MAG: archease [Candidatus Woesearchaeota archaeon]
MTKNKPFEYLEHTADCKFRAYGKTKEQRFGNAALAMFNIMTDVALISPAEIREINVTGTDEMQLLYNFLEQLLFLLDTESFIPNRIIEISIEGNVLHAKLYGDCDLNKYDIHGDVKAVTYNEMEFCDDYVQVVVDL